MPSKQKIVFLAPFEPYRSGIAKHSSQVAQELARRDNVDLTLMSFKRLYPQMLFPGESDKDPAAAPFDPDISFDLDTVNPLSWMACAKRIKQINPDVLIIPVWTFFVAPCLGWIAGQARKSGIKVQGIIHNAFDHENGNWKDWLIKNQLKRIDYFVCHNQSLANQINTALGQQTVAISPHPIFDQYPVAQNIPARRAELELLFFGIIRDYKGLDILIDAVAMLKDVDFHLTIAGECWGKITPYQQQVARHGLQHKIEFIDRYVSDAEAAELFERADAIVLPYRSMTGTGVIPLAYHYRTPVITTDLEAFHEVVEPFKTGVISEGIDAQTFAQAVRQFLILRESENFSENTQKIIQLYTWENFCNEIISQ